MRADQGEVTYTTSNRGVDWPALKATLVADDFDNGRSPAQLQQSFERSAGVVFAWVDGRVVGTARLLSDGVCNAYLVDVWTFTPHRRRGIGSHMVTTLLDMVPGQHVALFTSDRPGFYERLGFVEETVGMSTVVGKWLRPDR
jgi:GNAT superfamily N-acetyltransferase